MDREKSQPYILIVDDEIGLLRALTNSLKNQGFKAQGVTDGGKAIKIINKELPDLLILDIIMPIMDGFEVCRRVRQISQIPIIMLSARHSEEDKIHCLNIGSDDYICKPFNVDELVARVKAILRRTKSDVTSFQESSVICGSMKIDFAKRQFVIDGSEISLTPTEFSILREFMLNVDKVLSHEWLLKRIWGPEYGSEKEYLRVFMRRLRGKIEVNPLEPKNIITVTNIGYQFRPS